MPWPALLVGSSRRVRPAHSRRRGTAQLLGAAPFVACALAFSGCSSTPTATITLTTGGETDTFSRAPAPTTLLVEELALDGTPSQLARVALPADDFSLGDKSRTEVGAVRATGLDATGKQLIRGESLYVQFGALEGAPLDVFVQRVGELARLPNPGAVLDAPKLGITTARYVIAASGTSVLLYDLLLLAPIQGISPFTRPAKSLVTFGTAAIAIDENGATTVDLSSATPSELGAPVGGTFAEIAGGATVALPDGSSFVVGGTRPSGGASPRVLAITKAGGAAFLSLATPREGACATWVEGRGLVVVGGSATGAGLEIVAPNSVLGTASAYPADAVTNCGASTIDASHVLVVGGVGSPDDVGGAAPARLFDLTCAANCKPVIWKGPMPLVRAESFTLASDAALVAGDDATGNTRAFRVTPAGATEIALKAARRNGRLIALPIAGTAAIVGGAAPLEQYLE